MKNISLFLLVFFPLCINAQTFEGNNKVLLKFETTKGGTCDFSTTKMATLFMLDLGQIELDAELRYFKPNLPKDTLFKLREILRASEFDEIVFKSSLPRAYTPEINITERYQLNGQLYLGSRKASEAINLIFLPKDKGVLEFDASISSELNDFQIAIPERLKSKLTGRFKIVLESAKTHIQ